MATNGKSRNATPPNGRPPSKTLQLESQPGEVSNSAILTTPKADRATAESNQCLALDEMHEIIRAYSNDTTGILNTQMLRILRNHAGNGTEDDELVISIEDLPYQVQAMLLQCVRSRTSRGHNPMGKQQQQRQPEPGPNEVSPSKISQHSNTRETNGQERHEASPMVQYSESSASIRGTSQHGPLSSHRVGLIGGEEPYQASPDSQRSESLPISEERQHSFSADNSRPGSQSSWNPYTFPSAWRSDWHPQAASSALNGTYANRGVHASYAPTPSPPPNQFAVPPFSSTPHEQWVVSSHAPPYPAPPQQPYAQPYPSSIGFHSRPMNPSAPRASQLFRPHTSSWQASPSNFLSQSHKLLRQAGSYYTPDARWSQAPHHLVPNAARRMEPVSCLMPGPLGQQSSASPKFVALPGTDRNNPMVVGV